MELLGGLERGVEPLLPLVDPGLIPRTTNRGVAGGTATRQKARMSSFSLPVEFEFRSVLAHPGQTVLGDLFNVGVDVFRFDFFMKRTLGKFLNGRPSRKSTMFFFSGL